MAEIVEEKRYGAGKLISPNDHTKVGQSIESLAKNPIQLTWKNIVITAQPPKGRCKPKNALKEPKEIIKGVSGTVMPG